MSRSEWNVYKLYNWKQVENIALSSEENIHLHEKHEGNSDKTLDPLHLHILHTYHRQYLW